MKPKSFVKLGGEVEVNEAFVGGRDGNKHAKKRKEMRGPHDKAAVAGVIKRKGPVVARVVAKTDMRTQVPFINDVVSKTAILVSTDDNNAYQNLGLHYEHAIVKHTRGEYVRGSVHTNTIENFWSLLKRILKGTYVSVEPFHLEAHVDEQAFRLNERQDTDYGRFRKVLSSVFGRWLTYKDLTQNDAAFSPA